MAASHFIPKIEDPDPNNILHFRELALLNVEGKLFFSLVSRRLYNHIVMRNKFIDTSVQKGCMDNIPGCWEHITVAWETLKEAKLEHKNVVSVRLDIANAYGSIPHQLIFFALRRYGIPKHWLVIITNYYAGICLDHSLQVPPPAGTNTTGVFLQAAVYP